MRIIDADILSYGLLEDHVATPYVRPLIEKRIKRRIGNICDYDHITRDIILFSGIIRLDLEEI